MSLSSYLIKKVLSTIPEGHFKEALRHLKNRSLRPITAMRKRHEHSAKWEMIKEESNGAIQTSSQGATFEFRGPHLHGVKVFFPADRKHPLYHLWYIWNDLPSYFSLYNIKKGSVIIDAGAYPGDFTVVAAQKTGTNGKVFAFEPNPNNRAYLEQVVQANGVGDRVRILPYALASSRGKSYHLDAMEGSRLVCTPRGRPVNQVELITLDRVLDQYRIFEDPSPLFVKMDIEGDEIKAIEGASQTLSRGARFAIAAYHEINGQPTWIKLKQLFREEGYITTIRYPFHNILFAQPPNNLENLKNKQILS